MIRILEGARLETTVPLENNMAVVATRMSMLQIDAIRAPMALDENLLGRPQLPVVHRSKILIVAFVNMGLGRLRGSQRHLSSAVFPMG